MNGVSAGSRWGKRIFGALLIVACATAAAIAYLWWEHQEGYQRTDNAYLRGDISTVSPRVEGYVAKVMVEDYQRVERGTSLVTLVNDRLLADAARERAALKQRAAALMNHDARLETQRAEIAVADARVETAVAEVARAENDRDRTDRLVKQGWTTKQVHDDNIAGLKIARARLDEARAEAGAERRRLDGLESEAEALQAEFESARAALQLAEIALEDAVVRAPIDGIVGNRKVQAGEFVRPGTQLLALVPDEGLWVEANFKETQIGAMGRGQPVHLVIDTFPGEVFCGSVDTLSPASGAEFALIPPDNATGNFTKIVRRIPVKIRMATNEHHNTKLRAGMSVQATVRTDAARSGNPHPTLVERLLATLDLLPRSRCY
jgi:membrane fusion protein (multidrug efflux system)